MRCERPFLLVALFLIAAAAAAQPPVTPGFPNVAQTPGTILSGLNAPEQGRTTVIAYHAGVLFTVPEIPASQPSSDYLVRTWDIQDPTAPIELAQHGVTSNPVMAHGSFKSGAHLVIGPDGPTPDTASFPWTWRRNEDGSLERTTFPEMTYRDERGVVFHPWAAGATYWIYNDFIEPAYLEKNGVRLAEWDHLGLTGVVGHPFLLGDLLIFAGDQSRTGVATYDVSDPSNPVLLDVLTTGGPGGYWPELWGGDGKLLIVMPYRTAGNGFRIVDVTDPTDLQLVIDQPLSGDRAMYVQFQDHYAFLGSHKVDLRTFESVLDFDGANTVRPSDGQIGVDTSQFALPLGNLVVFGGIGPNQGMSIWAHQAEPDTLGPSVGYHVPQAGRTNYPLGAPISLLIHETLESFTIVNGETFLVRPVDGEAIDGKLTFSFDDILTFTPDADLLPDTTYEVLLTAGGVKDAAGNGMVEYGFTFSTGSSVSGNRPPEATSLEASAWPVAPGADVTLTATADDPDDDPLEFRFDFGDGSATSWSAAASAQTSYAEPGHYRASVQVRDEDGAIASRTLTVTVAVTPTGPRPTQSSQIVSDPATRRGYVVHPDNDVVSAFDLDDSTVHYEAPTCADPRSIVRTIENELWITCFDDDSLRIHDAADGAFVDEIVLDYGDAPFGLATTPDGATIFATLSGSGEFLRFSAASRALTGVVSLGPAPRALAVSADGSRVLVARFLSPKNYGEIWDVDASTLAVETLRLPKIGGEENMDGTASGRGVANYLSSIVISPDGANAWVASTKTNTEKGLLFADDLDSDNTVRNMISRFDTATGEYVESVDLDNSQSASAIVYSTLGDYLYVALQDNNEIIVLDALRLENSSSLGNLATRLGAGSAPQGLLVDDATHRLYAKNFLGRNVSTFEMLSFLQTGNKNISSSSFSTLSSERLSPDVLLGKKIFYHASDQRMSAEGYLSCATCHLDGGHDARVWDFTGRGEGLRNTTSLRGRSGLDQGNVHWTANFDEIQDFENDVRDAFGGLGFLSDSDYAATVEPLGAPKAGLSDDLDALALYVASLDLETLPRSPHREIDGSMTAAGEAGRDVFAALACGTCHSGRHFTDSVVGEALLHDVGTLRTTSGTRLGEPLVGIDTPTLRGLWATAPYLHDGSAETLEDVFVAAGGELIPAESGTPSGGALIFDNFVDLNQDDTVRGRAFVRLNFGGERLTLSDVDGGSGGLGALELRFSTGIAPDLEVRINGALLETRTLSPTGNDPITRFSYWERERFENVPWLAGPVNTIELTASGAWTNLAIDDVIVTTADHLVLTAPHRAVLDLPVGERDDLLAYLLQLDGSYEAAPCSDVFCDGFESGDLSAWSSHTP